MGKNIIDVEKLLQLLFEFNNYKENDKRYIFYYDETNNYRKVRITKNGFNDNRILMENYVIGGICIDKSNPEDITELKKKLKINERQELKSSQLYRGKKNFEQCLKNKNLNLILEWIIDNAYIHYVDMDNFYYTVIDIVDSVCANDIGRIIPKDLVNAMKDDLYFILKDNLDFFIQLCNKTNYPNIVGNSIIIFCDALIELIENELQINYERYFVLETFEQLLKMIRKDEEMIFLNNYEEKTIVESFHGIRQNRCIIFQKSFHIFDNEEKDKKAMENEKMILKNGSELKNYKFVDSNENFAIQISDCIVSLIAKYLKFITYNSVTYINEYINNMTNLELDNMNKFVEILNKSDYENKFFIQTINSQRINLNRKIMNEHIEFILRN